MATHYAAFRPPLHEPILAQLLAASKPRRIGIDIGCGTGCSAHALAVHCEQTIGIDPSFAMLLEARGQTGTSFVNASGEAVPVARQCADTVTLAGSLNYLDRDRLVPELLRICRPGAEIAVYDFCIDLADIEALLTIADEEEADYDHCIDLAGYAGLELCAQGEAESRLALTPTELAHLLLAGAGRHRQLAEAFDVANPFEALVARLAQEGKRFELSAQSFHALYTAAGT